jgi:hypothetical protein
MQKKRISPLKPKKRKRIEGVGNRVPTIVEENIIVCVRGGEKKAICPAWRKKAICPAWRKKAICPAWRKKRRNVTLLEVEREK